MVNMCEFPECDRDARTKGLCHGHYRQRWKGAELKPLRPRAAEGLRYGDPCTFEGCDRTIRAKGLCQVHYYQARRGSDLKPIRAIGAPGGGSVNSEGYRVVWRPGHPNASGKGLILERRLVMSESLGRALLPGETVHHMNGVRLDNRLENLELWTKSHPNGQRVADKVAWARELLALYGEHY